MMSVTYLLAVHRSRLGVVLLWNGESRFVVGLALEELPRFTVTSHLCDNDNYKLTKKNIYCIATSKEKVNISGQEVQH